MSERFEAAQILCRYNNSKEGQQILQAIWENPANNSEKFSCYMAFMELWIASDRLSAMIHMEEFVSGYGPQAEYWETLSLSEQAIVYEWLGQVQLVENHKECAFASLNRAASLGRDSSLLWRLLGELSLQQGDMEMSIRYLKRSLQLYRQLDLEILSGRTHTLGAFLGKDPLNWSHQVEDYLKTLLVLTKTAKGRKNLKAAREILMEMLHQFPEEPRLPKLRLMIEKSIVEHSLFVPASRPQIEAR